MSRRLLVGALLGGVLTTGATGHADEPGALGSSNENVRSGALVPSAPSSLGPPPVTATAPSAPFIGPPATDSSSAPAPVSTVLSLPPPRLEYQRRYNLVIVGAGLMLSTWGADRLLAVNLPDSSLTWLPWLPLVGPWYLLYTQQQLAAPNPATSALLVFDGLLQAGGLTVGILGFVLHKKRMVMSLPPTAGVRR